MSVKSAENPAVSVIIPVFNVEDYLDRCLKASQISLFLTWRLFSSTISRLIRAV